MAVVGKHEGMHTLAKPRLLGAVLRGVAACISFGAGALTLDAGGLWLIAPLGFMAFGILLAAAALVREPGCEINLIWARLFGRKPINCFLFGPVDKWEEQRCNRGCKRDL